MSGLHSSINTHVSAGFEDPFTRKFITNTTYFYSKVGEHEDRVKNLYMIYAAVLKSVSLLEQAYQKQVYVATNKDENAKVKQLAAQVF